MCLSTELILLLLDPVDIELDIAASCVKVARGELMIVGDYKNRIGVYNLLTGDLLQDLTGLRSFDAHGFVILPQQVLF
jgi:hypothetical protein